MPKFVSLLIVCCSLIASSATAQTEEPRQYTEQSPLVYEDCCDLWPYAYLNDDGQPEGFNIDLVSMMMEELKIPYVIKLKPQQEVFNDLKAHVADLTFGLAAGFHDEYGKYGRHSITLFTQSVVTPKSSSVKIKTFRDLSKPGIQVIVNDSSLCYHLMHDYGWGEHAIVTNNMKEAIMNLNSQEEGQIVWNTLSLKWLINHYQLNNLKLTPVNMPHGDYKFMSNDQLLLNLLDATYSNLYIDDKITRLQNKWFYPEHQSPTTPAWVWGLIGVALLLLVIAIVYYVRYRRQNEHVTKANDKLNRRLALIIETTKVRIWTYDVRKHQFAWHNKNGRVAYTYSMEEFSHRYSEDDFEKLKDALERLATQHKDAKGHEEEEVKLELKAKDRESGDRELHDFVVVISVLSRDKKGKPTMIIGTKKDVTEARRMKRLEEERTLRYWSVFYSQDAAIFQFDQDGYLTDASPKACEICHYDADKIIKQHIHLNDFFQMKFSDLQHTDQYRAIHKINDERIEFKMKTIFDDENKLLGIFAFCRKAIAMLILLLSVIQVSAQALTDRYNKERPVVIVCDRNNPPYQFLNDKGIPAGSDIDVIKAVMNELGLPCAFIMQEWIVAQNKFESGDADLILSDDRNYEKASYIISENIINFNRISKDYVAEIHFIGKDRQLIEEIDDKYSRLKQKGDIAEIQNVWMHPERVKPDSTATILYITAALLLLAAILYLFVLLARLHVKRVNRDSTEINDMMFKVLHMGNYDVMLYDIANNLATNQYGNILPEKGLTLEAYIKRIHPEQREEFVRKSRSLHDGSESHFDLNKRWNIGTEEEPHYLYFQGHAICETDENGQPAYVINAVNDVTQEIEIYQAARDIEHRYNAILSDPFVAMSFYNNEGVLIERNEAMKNLLASGGIKASLLREVDAQAHCHIQPLYNDKGEIANYLVTASSLKKST